MFQCNPDLTTAIAEYRRQFREQMLHDLDYNIQNLRHWMDLLHDRYRVMADAQVEEHFQHLVRGRAFLENHDAWMNAQLERNCWLAFHQFYHDALALAHRLLRYEQGLRPRRRRQLKRRQVSDGASAFDRAQAMVNFLEKNLPNVFDLRPISGVLPLAWYSAGRSLLPWTSFHWPDFFATMHRVLSSGVINSLLRRSGPLLEIHGRDELLDNDELFDRRRARMRHNVIIAASHRHSTLDLPLAAEALHGIEHAMWGEEAYYPKSAARDTHMVVASSVRRRGINPAFQKAAEIMREQGLPVVIVVDGGGPYFLYGQQMHIKRGLRRIVDYLRETTRTAGRRTYIVPLTGDDPAALVRGLDSTIRIKFHPPICMDDVEDAPHPPDRQAPNRGDPLLIHLEALFLVNTGQMRHGWQTPQVIEAVRYTAAQQCQDHSLRGSLRKRFHPSLTDLARFEAAAFKRRQSVPPGPCADLRKPRGFDQGV